MPLDGTFHSIVRIELMIIQAVISRIIGIIIASKIATLQCKVWEDGKAALANAERVPVAETGANGH